MAYVLIIDDDMNVCQLLEDHLVREGMKVHFEHDGMSGLRSALSGDHDLVILDLTLPELTGLEVTKRLRAQSRIGIVTLSDRADDVDKIIGLECGADDHLTKPFNPRELIARIRAIFRRRTPWLAPGVELAPEHLEVGDLSLDGGSRTCRRNAELIDLTTVEFDLLSALLHRNGHVIHRRDLVKRVLEREYSPFDRSIDVHVSNLRRKLGTLPDGAERIRSVRNVGYLYTHATASESMTA